MKLTKNEIIALRHLSDGKGHSDTPAGMTEAQYFVAIKSLEAKDMVEPTYSYNSSVANCSIKTSGKAWLDDIADVEESIRKQVIKEHDISVDQYEVLTQTLADGKMPMRYKDIPGELYKQVIWSPLYQSNYLEPHYNHGPTTMVITYFGKQLLDEIADEVTRRLASDGEEEFITGNIQKQKTKANVSGSHFRIREGKATDVIKTLWALNSCGVFKKEDGSDSEYKLLMDELSEFFQSNELKNAEQLMNKSLKSSERTFLRIFDDMTDNATNYRNEAEYRKQGK